MKYRLMDILACPYCKVFPLKLLVFEERNYENRKALGKVPLCELYCQYKGKFLKELGGPPPCDECIKKEVVAGILICEKCNRWYPIIDEIPVLLPDELRKEKEDLEFLRKYRNNIPEYVLYKGKPFNLSKPS
ncbi:MAG: hypothetical protein B6U69_03960 [Thermofilum sp. ex4484_15]|nr:MAG: hypothetical protein B6U69_03960 [Thermofilum sp. ex4484_15]